MTDRHPDPTRRPATAADLELLDCKIKNLLPPRYQHCYASIGTTSMGSAGLRFRPDGTVAWDRIWTTFCDLGLAGGPPHRATLLEPVPAEDVAADPDRYREVAAEVGRAVTLAAGPEVVADAGPGWVGFACESPEMAAWLVRAVVAENVSARHRGCRLLLPAGPRFRLEKEIKNVVAAAAKACHFWAGHLPAGATALRPRPIAPPELPVASQDDRAALLRIASAVGREVGWACEPGRYAGWVGVPCPDEATAVWLLRAVAVEDVLTRREGRTLYLPTGSGREDEAGRVADVFVRARELWAASSGAVQGDE